MDRRSVAYRASMSVDVSSTQLPSHIYCPEATPEAGSMLDVFPHSSGCQQLWHAPHVCTLAYQVAPLDILNPCAAWNMLRISGQGLSPLVTRHSPLIRRTCSSLCLRSPLKCTPPSTYVGQRSEAASTSLIYLTSSQPDTTFYSL
jgi:hypothetical protein